jgi:hypothetical protein
VKCVIHFSNAENVTLVQILPVKNMSKAQNIDQENKTSLVLNFMEE